MYAQIHIKWIQIDKIESCWWCHLKGFRLSEQHIINVTFVVKLFLFTLRIAFHISPSIYRHFALLAFVCFYRDSNAVLFSLLSTVDRTLAFGATNFSKYLLENYEYSNEAKGSFSICMNGNVYISIDIQVSRMVRCFI